MKMSILQSIRRWGFFNDHNLFNDAFEEGILCSCCYHLAVMLKYCDLGFIEKKVFQKIDCSCPLLALATPLAIASKVSETCGVSLALTALGEPSKHS